MIPEGDYWIEHDENGNPYGRWYWNENDGVWIFEKLPPRSGWNIAEIFNDPARLVAFLAVALIGSGFIVWLFIILKSKFKK